MAERKDGMPRVKRNTNTTTRVMDYLRRNPDIVIPYQEIARELNLRTTPEIGNAVSYLVKRGIADIDRPIKGMVIYHSGNVTEKQRQNIADALAEKGEAEWPLPESPAETQARIQDAMAYVSPQFDYVGKMQAYSIIRDSADDLYVAMPLMAFLQRIK